MAWYDEELLKDPYVAGAAIYVCGVSDWQWKTYAIWPELAQILAQQATPVYRPTDPGPPDEEAMWVEVLETLDRMTSILGKALGDERHPVHRRSELMDKPKVYDQQGQEKDWDWLIANFGPLELERTEVPEGVNQVYRIAELHDREGPAVEIVHVVDQGGGAP